MRPALLAAITRTTRVGGAHLVRFSAGPEVRVEHGSPARVHATEPYAAAAFLWAACDDPAAVGGPPEESWAGEARAIARAPEASDTADRLAALLAEVHAACPAPELLPPAAAPPPGRRPAPLPAGRVSRDPAIERWANAARTEEALAERRDAIDELRQRYGIAIAPPAADDGWFVEDQGTVDLALAVRNSFLRGNRNLVLYGPPGVGKSTVPKRIAAMLGMGYVQITCARGMDTVMLLGTDVIEQTADGQPVQRVRLGTLAAAAQFPVVIELAEAGELDGEFLTNLNQLLDEGLLTLWSAAPGEKVIHRHPECVIALTSNTGRGDRHLPESIDDRAGVNIVLTYPAEDEEATRIAVQALALLGRPLDRSDDAPSVAEQHPELHRRAIATQRLVAGLRDDWVERAIPRAPGLRTAAHFLADLEQSLAGDGLEAADAERARERALRIALKRFVGLWNLAQHDPAVVEQELLRRATAHLGA